MTEYYEQRGFEFASLAHLRKRKYLFDKVVLKMLPPNRDANILDLGCGCGDFIHYCYEKGYKNAIGIDDSEGAISAGQKMGPGKLVVGDGMEWLDDKSNTFDFVIMGHVLEHFTIKDGQVLLHKISRSLKAKGKLCVFVPNTGSVLGLNGSFGDITHLSHFTGSSLRQTISISKFDVLFVSGTPIRAVGLKGIIGAMAWPILRFFHLAIMGFPSSRPILEAELMAVASKKNDL